MVLLDYIRYHQHLVGTKIGCREGDCGACTVLVGALQGEELHYQSMTSCLLPIGALDGRHVVTIEGTQLPGELNSIQQAMADEGATQCGFCTPGFVMSLTGFCLSGVKPTHENALSSIDGNICRCTGYKSIERAATRICSILNTDEPAQRISFATQNKMLPGYFINIRQMLSRLEKSKEPTTSPATLPVGGGTDLYVQKHDEMSNANVRLIGETRSLSGIRIENGRCIIGAATTITQLKESVDFNKLIPSFHQYARLISSTPIRNMATVGGNFVNASPIGDLTIFFLALDAQIELLDEEKNSTRTMLLRDFYRGYKDLAKTTGEILTHLSFEVPANDHFFHFEKVSKRTHLDIASVNTAIGLTVRDNTISKASLSAGGVAPIPLYLGKTSSFLRGKTISRSMVAETISIAVSEISPISDTRGSKEYKSLLLAQLIRAHFMTLFPQPNQR